MFGGDWPASEVPVAHIVRRDYRIREGDQLQIIYHVRHQRNPQYRIKIQDVIAARFPFKPELNQVEQVQSDGKLYLDLIEPVPVFGHFMEADRKMPRDPATLAGFPQATTNATPSNLFLVMVAETGIVGLALIVLVFLSIFHLSCRLYGKPGGPYR